MRRGRLRHPGTYASLGTGTIGGYQENQQVLHNDAEWPETKAAVEAFGRRRAACHGEGPMQVARSLSDENGLSFWQPDLDAPRLLRSRHAVFNLTRPERSMVLLAPLDCYAVEQAYWRSLWHRPETANRMPLARRPQEHAGR